MTTGRQVEALGAEADRVELLELRDARRDVRHQRQAVSPVEILEQPTDRRSGRRERVVAQVDGLVGLVHLASHLHQRIVHPEPPDEGQKLLHGPPDIPELSSRQ